jgi:hypothetical protein
VIDFNLSNPHHTPIPRWNYKRADWTEFVAKSEALCGNINFQSKRIGETAQAFSKAILTAALESIPRGARKDYKPYWTQELQNLEDQVTAARESAEGTQSFEANIAYKAISAQYRKTLNSSVRDSWVKKTESLNLDRDGRKLWRFAKVLNSEDCRGNETVIQANGKMVTG